MNNQEKIIHIIQHIKNILHTRPKHMELVDFYHNVFEQYKEKVDRPYGISTFSILIKWVVDYLTISNNSTSKTRVEKGLIFDWLREP